MGGPQDASSACHMQIFLKKKQQSSTRFAQSKPVIHLCYYLVITSSFTHSYQSQQTWLNTI